jgi:hypothetical protein
VQRREDADLEPIEDEKSGAKSRREPNHDRVSLLQSRGARQALFWG